MMGGNSRNVQNSISSGLHITLTLPLYIPPILCIALTLQIRERISTSDAAQLWRKRDYVTLGAHVAYQGLTVIE